MKNSETKIPDRWSIEIFISIHKKGLKSDIKNNPNCKLVFFIKNVCEINLEPIAEH